MGVLVGFLTLLIAAAIAAAGAAKVTGSPGVMGNLDRIGAARWSNTIGGAELALAGTLAIGMVQHDIRRVGAVGAVIVYVTAVVFHIRAGDGPDDWGPAAVLAFLSLIVLVFG